MQETQLALQMDLKSLGQLVQPSLVTTVQKISCSSLDVFVQSIQLLYLFISCPNVIWISFPLINCICERSLGKALNDKSSNPHRRMQFDNKTVEGRKEKTSIKTQHELGYIEPKYCVHGQNHYHLIAF